MDSRSEGAISNPSAAGRSICGQESGETKFILLAADQLGQQGFGELCSGAFDDLIRIYQVVFGGAGDDLSLFDVGNEISALFEIGGDLRGEEDTAFTVSR